MGFEYFSLHLLGFKKNILLFPQVHHLRPAIEPKATTQMTACACCWANRSPSFPTVPRTSRGRYHIPSSGDGSVHSSSPLPLLIMAAAASMAAAARLVAPGLPSASLRAARASLRGFWTPRPSSLRSSSRFRAVTGSASSSSAATVAATIAVGDKLPEATLSYFDSEGELQSVSVSDLTKGKKVVLFAVPGAFTPTCSQKHLPGFAEKAGELKEKGVDTIACVSVNDVFVMRAWKEDLSIGDRVLLLSDGNLEFTRALGVELDLSDKPVGLGVRSRRYSLLAVDGVVTVLNLEEGGAFTVSGVDDILGAL